MKNLNLLNRLLSYSHEKQSPQRFARYAVMLIMLLTLGVGQMWGKTVYLLPGVWTTNGDDSKTPSFWVHSWGSEVSDVKMSLVSNESEIYEATVPDDNNNFIFTRNKSDASGTWDNTYNQTPDITNNSNNFCQIKAWSGDGWYQMNANAAMHTVYFPSNNANVYVNVSRQNDNNTAKLWRLVTMTDTGKTYKGVKLNVGSFLVLWDGLYKLQFKEGESWGSMIIDSWTGSSTYNGKLYDGSSWVAYHYDHQVTFDGNGNTGGSMTAQTMPYNTATAIKANGFTKTDYTFTGWNTKADGSGDYYAAGANITVTDSDVKLYAQWTQTGYYIVGAFNSWNHPDSCRMTDTGTANEVAVTLRFRSADFSGSSYKTQFKVRDWTSSSGTWYGNNDRGDSKAISKSGNNPTTLTASNSDSYNMYLDLSISAGSYTFRYNTSTKVLTVDFPVNNRIDFFSPSTDYANMTLDGSVYSVNKELAAQTTYTFKLEWLSDFYGDGSSFTDTKTISGLTTNTGNMSLTTIVAGTYTFSFNTSNKDFTVTYPDKYTVTYSQQPAAAASAPTIDKTLVDGYIADGTTIQFTKGVTTNTGYSWKGWYNNTSGSGEALGTETTYDGTVSGADLTVYAVYTPNEHTITLSQSGETGYGSAGTESVDATYAAAMPAIASLPSGATGYKFQGYFTGHNGTGTRFTDASGAWVSNVTDTISSGNWRLDNTLTLYAYFEQAEIATLPLSASMVHPWVSGGTMDSITVEPTLTLVPEGTVLICYTIQYSDGSAVADDGLQTFRRLGGNNIRFRAPQAAGSYRVHAELKTDNCSGEVLDTKNAEFAVAGDYSVTVKYICDGKAIRDQEVLTINSLDSTSITAPTDIFGYTFSEWEMSAGITSNTGASANPKKFVASYDGIITAKYVETPIVYFYNNLGWSDVYVTYDGYFDGTTKEASDAGRADGAGGLGSGNYGKTYHHMTKIEGTDIWYDVVPEYYTNNGFEHWAWNITFNNVQLGTLDFNTEGHYKHFNTGEAVMRYDFDPQATMFVPTTGAATYVENGVTYKSSTSTYHNDEKLQVHNCGYWKKYNNTSSGYSLRGTFGGIVGDESDWVGTYHNLVADSPDAHEFSTKLKLYSDKDYFFRIFRNNKYLKLDKASGFTQKDLTINQSTHRVDNAFRTDCGWVNSADVTLHTSTEGEYTFYVNFQDDGTMLVTVDFPDNAGDYQVLYKDDEHTKWHPAGVIDADATENITSFFVRKDQSPVIKWRKSTAVANDGTITWGALQDVNLSAYTGSGAILDDSSDQYGVYNFHFNIAGNTLSLTDVDEYKGSYYIRTNCASEWKWEHYTEADHRMTYSDYADANSGFSHYFMKYAGAGTNVKFVVANDYSICISDTMEQGGQSDYVDASSNLIANANIRFSWNMHDNSLNRAYVGMVDRTHTPRVATRFIVLQGQADMLLDKDGNALNSANQGTMYVGDNAIEFDDDENWVYETTVKAKAGGRIKIYSHVNGHDYYLVGDSPLSGDGAWTEEKSDYLITGTGDDAQKIRVIYDFKTGRLISAWLPSVAVNEPMTVKADVMIVREHQEPAEQINMNSSGRIQLTDGKTVYGVMRFNKYILNNLEEGTSTPLPEVSRKTVNERSNYYISFPFDVKVSDIFGFGSYGPDWTLRYYDGKGRAKNGYWADSNSFWKYVPPFGTLNANEGYLLSLNMNNFTTSSDVWNNGVENIELYFPATGTINIQQVSTFDIDSLKVAEYKCTINRNNGEGGDRRIADSFWRCIGVPSFAQKTVANNEEGEYAMNWHTDTDDGLPFLYEVNWRENDLVVQKATSFTFQPMHAYMVQNGNLIRWTNVIRPASVAQRTTEVNELTFRMELSKNNVMQDQTYIRLTDKETVTSAFDFGQDLSKEFRNDANIYTMIGYEKAAANSMPFSESTIVIPMGVKMSESGEYTFAMPDGTHGVSVILVDNMLNTRTNLGLLDYTVYLDAGQTDGRFSLEIAPIQQMPTDIEAVSDQHSAVRKVMIDGILYIVKDGKVFDARGAVVK